MTKNEFSAAVKLAKNFDIDLSMHDDTVLFGCGLPGFTTVHVTVEQVAKFVRYQCACLNGSFDGEELNNCAEIARKKFLCVG